MRQQVGDLVFEGGLAQRGLLLRHLVMPGHLDETRAILRWIVPELGPNTHVDLMDQYHPAGKVSATQYAEINRRLTSTGLQQAKAIARDLGLRRPDHRRMASPARD